MNELRQAQLNLGLNSSGPTAHDQVQVLMPAIENASTPAELETEFSPSNTWKNTCRADQFVTPLPLP